MARRQVTITSVGAQGDGIAEGHVFVPFGLPGETVEAEIEGKHATDPVWRQCSDLRVEPACQHFGDCGGCKVQHMSDDYYVEWKSGLVSEALSKAGIETALEPLIRCARHSRRRTVFSVVVTTNGAEVGYQRAGSHHVVSVNRCHVITPNLLGCIPMIGEIARTFVPVGQMASFTVLESLSGFDISVVIDKKIRDAERRAINTIAISPKIARIAVNTETIIENRRPVLDFSGFKVSPPNGGFVQAVQSIENAMVRLVCDHLAGCKRVADIFSGSGTFSLPLARSSSVVAAEGEASALTALDRAWREASGLGLKPIQTDKRDLHNRPLMAKELDQMKIQGVVFDPPRAGAQMQAAQLAASKVKRVAAVSCNPTTLARDLRILVDGGYTLQSITPLDQFLWSPHVEAVALLKRGKK